MKTNICDRLGIFGIGLIEKGQNIMCRIKTSAGGGGVKLCQHQAAAQGPDTTGCTEKKGITAHSVASSLLESGYVGHQINK